MNTSRAIEILTEWVMCNNMQRSRGQSKVRMDKELEEVRDWLLANERKVNASAEQKEEPNV